MYTVTQQFSISTVYGKSSITMMKRQVCSRGRLRQMKVTLAVSAKASVDVEQQAKFLYSGC